MCLFHINYHIQTYIYRTRVTVEISEDEGEETIQNKVTRSKSQQATTSSANGAAEEVDGWGYDPSASGFIRTSDGFVVVFTDGACSQNGKVGAKAGVGVWFNHNNPLLVLMLNYFHDLAKF